MARALTTPPASAGSITTWPQFAARVRPRGCSLLRRLPEFADTVLVAGCQRSGTTMLARVLSAAPGMGEFRFGRDDELDAALILSGAVEFSPQGRYCFQTTYLNDCVGEYFEHKGAFRLVWVLRNPFSVVRSMTHNWKRFALHEMVEQLATDLMTPEERKKHASLKRLALGPLRPERFALPRARQARLAYAAKSAQVFALAEKLSPSELCVVDYDELVRGKETLLPEVCAFAGVECTEEMLGMIRSSSLNKADGLSAAEREAIKRECLPVYERALGLRTVRPAEGRPGEASA